MRTSIRMALLLLFAWRPVVGIESSTSPCVSDSFEVQFRAVCPAEPSEVEVTFEESKHPTLVVRNRVRLRTDAEPFTASFGPSLLIAKTQRALFSVPVKDATIFGEAGRQRIQLQYPTSIATAGGSSEMELKVCEDKDGRCLEGSKSLVPKEYRFTRCQVPELVTIPVYSGCR